jgi:hypothetical protein
MTGPKPHPIVILFENPLGGIFPAQGKICQPELIKILYKTECKTHPSFR